MGEKNNHDAVVKLFVDDTVPKVYTHHVYPVALKNIKKNKSKCKYHHHDVHDRRDGTTKKINDS